MHLVTGLFWTVIMVTKCILLIVAQSYSKTNIRTHIPFQTIILPGGWVDPFDSIAMIELCAFFPKHFPREMTVVMSHTSMNRNVLLI